MRKIKCFDFSGYRAGLLFVGFTSLAIVGIVFSFVIVRPDDYFFLNAGDGLKGYFAMAYYIKYDVGTHFTGMNYPFGEHINFPDLQPLVSYSLRILQLLGLPVAEHTVGIVNLLALMGLAFTPIVMYAILCRTHLPAWYAALAAILIGFMSPQIERLGGHMSLSYACFIPITWYCLIRIQESPLQIRWYIVFGLSSLLMAGTSAYFLACASFFAFAHALVFSWQLQRPGPFVWRLVLAALLPLLAFRSWLWLTDSVSDRPQTPYGFLVYLASPATVFTPVMAPLRDLWQALFHTETAVFEGWAYVGLVGSAVAVASLAHAIGRLRNRQWKRLGRPVLPLHLRSGLWAAGLLLLLAFGWPFKFSAFNWLVDYAGPLKQFRALGRFAWPFFYVFSTYAAYYLFRWSRYLHQRGAGAFARGWIVIPMLIWAGEAYIQVQTKAEAVKGGGGATAFMDESENLVLQQLTWTSLKANDFQAIMPLPYFSVGTEKTDIPGSEASFREAFKTSLALGLPLVASAMARTSIGQSLQHIQLLSSTTVDKELLRHLPSTKPFLLLVTPDALSPAEQRLVSLGRKLVSTPSVTLYELPIAALAATDKEQELVSAIKLMPNLTNRGRYLSSSGKGAIMDNFDKSTDRRGRLMAGSFYEPAAKFSVLYNGSLPAPADTGRYEASVWINGKTEYGYGNMQVKLYGPAGQQIGRAHV